MVSYRLGSTSYSFGRKSYTRNPRTGTLVRIIRVCGYYLGRGVLGMTNCLDKIWIRDGLDPYEEKKVLRHEEAHIADPFASEHEIRRRTSTIYI
jgi:hypothetical protein